MKALALLGILLATTAHAGFMRHCMREARRVCIATRDTPSTTTTTTLPPGPCSVTVAPFTGDVDQPSSCEATPKYCVTIHGCGYEADVPYCLPWEVMDVCAYRSTCQAFYGTP